MKITNVEVNNFKSLSDLSISGFGKVNLLYGYNNSGKSNFLKFLELLFKSKTIESKEEYEEDGVIKIRKKVEEYTPFWEGYLYDLPFLFKNNDRDKPIKFTIDIEMPNSDYPESATLKKEGYLYSNRNATTISISGIIRSINQNDSEIQLTVVKLKNKKIYSNPKADKGLGKYFEGSKQLKGNSELFNTIMEVFNDSVLLIESERYFTKETQNQAIEALSSNNFKSWIYDQYLDADKYEDYVSLLKFLNDFQLTANVKKVLNDNLQSFPFNDTKLGFSKFGHELEVMLENKFGRFPLKNYGTGIQQVFYIFSKIFETDAKIVLIEELELNLSPEYQELIINNLQKLNEDNIIDQIFFTSHSDYLCRDDYKVFEMQIDKRGESTMKSSKYDNLKAMRRKVFS